MIKTKERIAEFGEVFTAEREVKAMLDLVEDETRRIDSRFLEPACGDGNFLCEILLRKLEVVRQRYGKSQLEFERNTFTAVSSIYGIDILNDNVDACRQRLFNIVKTCHHHHFNVAENHPFFKAIKFVLARNIIHGDALTLNLANSNTPIVFSQWCFTTGSKVKRTDYTFRNLLAYKPFRGESLFSDLGEEAHLPHPKRHYKAVHFHAIANSWDHQ